MFDTDKFNQAFAEALPGHEEKLHAKAMEKSAALGLAMPDLGGAVGDFCSQWPKIKGFINLAVSVLGWIYPKQAAAVKAFLAATESTLIPALCQK